MTAPAYPNLHRIAYGEGARLTAEARVEAADPSGDPDQPFVVAVGVLYVRPDFACNAWQPIPLTPAHDKEKS